MPPTEISVKALVEAITEAQKPLFDSITKAMTDVQKRAFDDVRKEAANGLIKDAKRDPNSQRFLAGLLMSPDKYNSIIQREADEALEQGYGLQAAAIARAAACVKKFHNGDLNKLCQVMADEHGNKALALKVEKSLELGKTAEGQAKFAAFMQTGTEMTKAMSISDPTSGGFWTQEIMANDFIPLLRPVTIMGKLRMRPYPMDAPRVIIPRLDAASQGYWVGESKSITVSSAKAGRVTLNEKYAGALIVVTNQLLRSASPAADAALRDDILKVLKLLVDLGAINGTGGDFQPKGLFNLPIQTLSINARVDADTMLTMMEKLWSQNIPMLSPGAFFNSALQRDFMRLRDANGQFIYKNEMKDGTLEGCNWAMTTQITNQSGANSKTDLCVLDASEFFYGDFQMGFNLDMSNEASYKDSDGSIQNTMQNQETLIVGTFGFDCALRHDPAAVHASDVWTSDT
ncbi:MAG: phage major capsid protein [Candidatus Xenobia bacterium]